MKALVWLPVAAALALLTLAACDNGNTQAAPTARASAVARGVSGATAAASVPDPVNDGPPFVIVPMKWVADSADPKGGTVELRADGSVVINGRSGGGIAGARVVNSKGQPEGGVDKAGNFRMFSKDPVSGRFGPNDEFAGRIGETIVNVSIADDGTITSKVDGLPVPLRMKLQGFEPRARRTAALLSFFALGEQVKADDRAEQHQH